MSQRIWDKFLTERDRAVFAAGGFGARAGFGKRPALLVIDVKEGLNKGAGVRSRPLKLRQPVIVWGMGDAIIGETYSVSATTGG